MYQRKSTGRWEEHITLPDGKVKTITAATKSALKKKLQEYYQKEESGLTYEEVSDAWEEARASRLALSTYTAYKPHIARAKEQFGKQYAKDITPDQIQAYIDGLGAKGYAKDTVHRARVILNEIFKYAITSPGSAIKYNPCSAVSIPRNLSKTRREPPTREQIAKITPDSDMGLLAYFLLYTGLRIGELLALRWEDVDLKNNVIHVTKSVTYVGNKPQVKEPKTAAGVRDVDLLDRLKAVLPNKSTGYIFGGKQPMDKMVFRRAWLKWCVENGLAETTEIKHTSEGNKHTYTRYVHKPLVTPHQFRHEYASMLEDAGVSEFQAMQALGHSSIKVTKDVYTHIRETKADRLGDKLNAYLNEAKV